MSCQKKTIVKVFIIIGLIIFFFAGAYVVILGYDKITSAGTEPDMMKIKATNKPQIITSGLLAHTANPIIDVVVINYSTYDVFSPKNPINYTILANYTMPNNIDHILAIDTSADSDISSINAENINYTIRDNEKVGHVTVLYKDTLDHLFIGSKSNYIPQAESRMAFLMFFVEENGTVNSNFLFVKENPLIIYPPSVMFQVETDRDLRNQIIESTKTNDIITGLTLIIIGLIPMGFVAEFLIESSIEHYFYRKKDSG